MHVDIVILGAGFAGSLTAMIARRLGWEVLMLERGRHPRFAIGESTTPLANLLLEYLTRRYDLPRLLPLCNYGHWKAVYPQLRCGLKRGFSYFGHIEQQLYQTDEQHQQELLVAASYQSEDADTHWLRADVDAFFAKCARELGAVLWEDAQGVTLQRSTQGWEVGVRQLEEHRAVRCRFIVDAGGDRGWLAQQLELCDLTHTLHTHSRAVFSHWRGVARWQRELERRGFSTTAHPFPCDAAALHHVFSGGWMYVLRFDDDVVSAGFCVDPRRYPLPAESPAGEFQGWLRRFPSIAEQFKQAEMVEPPGRVIRTPRLQRRYQPAAGEGWVLLPHALGFIDALHSTGIALTMFGITRLARAWEEHGLSSSLTSALQKSDTLAQRELLLVDRIVAGSYASFHDFPRMVAMTMFYFAAAIWSELRIREQGEHPEAFLGADRPEWCQLIEQAEQLVRDQTITTSEFTHWVRQAITPFNRAGLADPQRNNMYPYPTPAE
ncbi:MAG: halogenase [Planctomycetaceae bacterium]|nr:MAG: halogenase [Planctomycetaceae bacterium]